MELQDYIHLIKKYFWISLLGAMIAAGLVFILNLNLEFVPMYTATSSVMVGGDVATVEQNLDYRTLADQFSDTYADLAMRYPVLQAVIDRLGLKGTTPKELKDIVTASVVENTQLIEITVGNRDPRLAAAIATETARQLVLFSPRVVRNFVLLVEEATVPTFPSLTFFLVPMLGAVLGYLLVTGLGFLSEFTRSPIYSAEEFNQRSNLPVLATVRPQPKRRGRVPTGRLPFWRRVNDAPWWPLVQVCRQRFTELNLPVNPHPPVPVVMVTSPTGDREKSLVAANLATAWARSGCRVALVDADLASPALNRWLRKPQAPGLSDLLGRTPTPVQVAQTLHDTDIPNLSLVPAGNYDEHIFDRVNPQTIDQALAQLSQFTDVIVLDGPPVLAGSEGGLFASQVNGVVLALKIGRTPLKAAEDAKAALENAQSHLWGAVLVDGIRRA